MKKIVITTLFAIFLFNTFAQKKPLTTDDFASWKLIRNQQISNNARYISYELNQQKGDGCLIIYDLKAGTNDTIPYGYKAKFSPNNDFVIFNLKPSADTTQKAKLAKAEKDKLPKDSVAIFNLATKEIEKFAKVTSFKVAREKASWTAILLEHNHQPNDSLAPDSTSISDSTVVKPKKKKKDCNDLIITNPITKSTFTFTKVGDYNISRNGKIIAFNTQSEDTTNIGNVIVFYTANQLTDTIFTDTCELKKMSISDHGLHLAFLCSKDTVKHKTYSLNLFDLDKNRNTTIDTLTPGIPDNYAPGVNGNISFSEDGSKLFFGTALKPKNEPKDSILDEEIPKLDVWSWTDKQLQPQQLLKLEKEKKRTYLTVYRIKDNKLITLADSINKTIKLVNKKNGEFALASNAEKYNRASSWNAQWIRDYYLVDLTTGKKERVAEGMPYAWLSPKGRFVVWYNMADSSYYSWNRKTKKITPLTPKLTVPFYYELNDMPTNPEPYGITGWGPDDKSVYIYDRYDIWKVDLQGKNAPVNITGKFGRENRIKFRYIKLDPELVYIPENKPILLKGFNEKNLQDGYFNTSFNKVQKPSKLLTGDYIYSTPKKAKNANILIWSRQNVKEYPNIRVSDFTFKNEKVISNANPQQKDFIWASTEPIEWTSFTGEKLRGILYKPENFNPSKKYPMVSYFYERNIENIHWHYIPYPSHSIINKTFYASNGYLVFVPDITYKTGYPGQSAYNSIVSGVNYLTNKFDFIDKEKLALQGQSWGGYQTAYLITQTDMFAAAMAGAPVSNMTSAYGGIRWESGWSRMFQYEHTQSRIGGSLWDNHLQYIENSPIFYAPKINTPLLIMHNDNDGAVPWYQGIELFVSMRRLDKPVWLLNYNGMKHNIESKYWANRVDLSKRMLQFFNHYLKDEPAPEWIIKGIPAIEKGENLGY